ncbi:aminotransferase-like domain-containing protein [Anaeromicrobium sediminis]|uniref:GntR family transcriptional regulator n=1 Tax=Anaeromicrobium sediminis TaxID=1478221 RepID=A0A267MJZ1_9FIRM|nr:PLP-dependent aminotransferase family protein [Anaeromicrobium sediminis]PAB59767.1 GntR family transcriptional regulator [Anaeromicrobium sediminis]
MEISWKPDKNSQVPLYKQIIDFIKGEVSSGNWTVGTKLPAQRLLAQSFGVNRSTLIEALEELKAEGIIEGKGGSSTRIANNTWALLISNNKTNWEQYIENGVHRPNLPTIQAINRLEFEPNIIRLGTGELSPNLFPKEMMRNILTKMPDRINDLGYLEPKGLLDLRKVICEYLKEFNINVSPKSVLIVSGALQALQLISIGITPLGSTILIENPSYIKSLHIFQSSGMKLVGLNMDKNGIMESEILNRINKRNINFLYTIPTFHNPTGTLMPMDRRKNIINLCEKERMPIIEDDVYRELWIDNEPPMPLKSIDKNGNVLYLGSISKSLAPGFRIGWIVGPEPIIDRLADIKMQTDYGSSSISQWAIVELISSGHYFEHLQISRKNLKIRRDLVENLLNKYFKEIATWNIPKGGFYIWLEVKRNINMKRLFDEALKENLLINPGYMYGHMNNKNIRISYSYAELEKLEKGLKKLAIIINHMENF